MNLKHRSLADRVFDPINFRCVGKRHGTIAFEGEVPSPKQCWKQTAVGAGFFLAACLIWNYEESTFIPLKYLLILRGLALTFGSVILLVSILASMFHYNNIRSFSQLLSQKQLPKFRPNKRMCSVV
jgi:hypothetical protein